MGHKVRPTSLRVGITEQWRSRWYATKANFSKLLVEDQKIRNAIKGSYKFAAISKIEVERVRDELRILLHTARPGLVIGRKGIEVDRIRDRIEAITGKQVTINIVEVGKPDLDAQLVAEGIAAQLEKRSSSRRTMKHAIQTAMDAGAKGVRARVAGRLGGSEMAKVERSEAGTVPLHTLDADIDYGFAEAATPTGHVGVKVWICKGKKAKENKQKGPADAVDAKKS